MARLNAMGWSRGGGPRLLGAVMAAAALSFGAYAVPAAAVSGGGVVTPTTVPTATTTTLPPVAKVPPAFTDGQPPQTLLDNAVALASLGVDDSALVTAVAATQAKLDADAIAARKAEAALDAASRQEAQARVSLQEAQGQYSTMAGAVRQAVIFLYTSGPEGLTVSPSAGPAALYAQDYADSTVGPYGVLARRQAVERQRAQAAQEVDTETRAAAKASADAAKALADQQVQLGRLKAELASASSASAAAVAADHVTLASQAGKELLSDSALQFTSKTPIPAPLSTTSVALTWAFAELGRQYVWGATGPDTFDCSGLTQFVWKAAGVAIPRVAADQDAWTIPVPLSQILPGDLVFFGTTDIHHVGIYIGDGLMINAPHTGTVVQVSSIWWSDLAGFGRVHDAKTPVPPHDTPTPAAPTPRSVVPAAGPVPAQIKPPAGWKPQPGSSSPIQVGPEPASGTSTTTSSTTSTSSPSTASTDTTTVAPPNPEIDPGTTTTRVPGSEVGSASDLSNPTTTTTLSG